MMDAESIINNAFEKSAEITPKNANKDLKDAVEYAIELLDSGKMRIATRHSIGNWEVNKWLKKAVLLSFRISKNKLISGGFTKYYDKVDAKFSQMDMRKFKNIGVRVVPPASIRRGAYIASGVVLMPCYINIGAFVDKNTMVDTWATVGSCAQIGKNVHLSGGVGIGGVLEPLQANPTIIEDNCFIGARSEIVEGVIVEEGTVISMGVYIGQSTKIFHRETGEIIYGRVPAGSVVVPGSLPAKDGSYSLYSAIIVKQVDRKTRVKTNINELLRNI